MPRWKEKKLENSTQDKQENFWKSNIRVEISSKSVPPRQMDEKTKLLMTMLKDFHPRADVDKL